MKHLDEAVTIVVLVCLTVYYAILIVYPPVNPLDNVGLATLVVAVPGLATIGSAFVWDGLSRYGGPAWCIVMLTLLPLFLMGATFFIGLAYIEPPPNTSYLCTHVLSSTVLYSNGTSIVHSITKDYNASYWHGAWNC